AARLQDLAMDRHVARQEAHRVDHPAQSEEGAQHQQADHAPARDGGYVHGAHIVLERLVGPVLEWEGRRPHASAYPAARCRLDPWAGAHPGSAIASPSASPATSRPADGCHVASRSTKTQHPAGPTLKYPGLCNTGG